MGSLETGGNSDREKNTAVVAAPSVTIVGDSTPSVFFECLDEANVADGLVPRFLVVEYTGDRPPTNPDAGEPPSKALVDGVVTLAAIVQKMAAQQQFIQVGHTPEADALLGEFDARVDNIINIAGREEVIRQAWNRAYLNVLKVASLIAVGTSPSRPVVTEEHARWAITLVERSVHTILNRFDRGEVGGGDASKAEARVRQAIEKSLRLKPEQRAKDELRIPLAMREGPYIPFSYLSNEVKRVQPFKDKSHLLKATLEEMVKSALLIKLTTSEAQSRFKVRTGDVFTLGPEWK